MGDATFCNAAQGYETEVSQLERQITDSGRRYQEFVTEVTPISIYQDPRQRW